MKPPFIAFSPFLILVSPLAAKQPNIILMIADDMGFSCIRAYPAKGLTGCKEVRRWVMMPMKAI